MADYDRRQLGMTRGRWSLRVFRKPDGYRRPKERYRLINCRGFVTLWEQDGVHAAEP